ncbi:hypothetical protein [Roseomonas indoligenes]|uniref:Uncharacterized protein n=1 Tax=Roseomonas indoligenes TaxID=2820811 RepID=A0A940S766_9PROT|nr:hypothetical protein [Pararoseomonas indoligenes]MBP0492733.1 hypothetical protein [Pararoseomonas indoligenes]
MRRTLLVLTVLSMPLVTGAAQAASPAQEQAQRQVESDQRQDRVTEVARDLERGGPSTPGVVDDMNRTRPTLEPGRIESRNASPQQPGGTNLPLLSDNPQR